MCRYIYIPSDPNDYAVKRFFLSLIKEGREIKLSELEKKFKEKFNFFTHSVYSEEDARSLGLLDKRGGFLFKIEGETVFLP